MTELSEEEKKAIKVLEEYKKSGFYILSIKYCEDRIHTNKLIERSLETALNLIQKQDTEINKLNNVIDRMAEKIYKDWESGDRVGDYKWSVEEVKQEFMKEETDE